MHARFDSSMTILALNVWFDDHEAEARRAAVLDQIAELDPDVVVLCEVNERFLRGLLADPRMAARYTPSVTAIRHPAGYDVVVLSASVPTHAASLPLQSVFARRAWRADVRTSLGEVACVGVHFESGERNEATRVPQVEACVAWASDQSLAVVAGDMNFEPSGAEDAVFTAAGFVDVWSQLRPGDVGFTRDTVRNRMAGRHGAVRQRRIDHIYVRGAALRPTKIEIIATEPVPGRPDVWPSDHFGLWAEFELRGPPRGG